MHLWRRFADLGEFITAMSEPLREQVWILFRGRQKHDQVGAESPPTDTSVVFPKPEARCLFSHSAGRSPSYACRWHREPIRPHSTPCSVPSHSSLLPRTVGSRLALTTANCPEEGLHPFQACPTNEGLFESPSQSLMVTLLSSFR